MPDVPTFKESGLPTFDFESWYGVWAPAGTPNAVVEKIAKDVSQALAVPESQERIAKSGAETMTMSPAEFARFVRSEADSVARIVKAAGIPRQ